MRKFVLTILALGAIGLALYQGYLYSVGPCARVLEYSLGQFDQDFGISREYFLQKIVESERVWEEAIGRELFRYNPEASFALNLVYDNRQAETESRRRAEFGLTAIEEAFEAVDARFEAFKREFERLSAQYENEVKNYEKAKADYERQVDFWNSRGGAPSKEYADLERERDSLNQTAQSLNTKAQELNRLSQELNELLAERNRSAEAYNKMAKSYNQKYGHGVEFNQAEYTGKEINIYQFTTGGDLVLALAHEFGHALGLDHVSAPGSLMYYVSEEGQASTLKLSEADLSELNRVCKVR